MDIDEHLQRLARDQAEFCGEPYEQVLAALRDALAGPSLGWESYGYIDEYGNFIQVRGPQRSWS